MIENFVTAMKKKKYTNDTTSQKEKSRKNKKQKSKSKKIKLTKGEDNKPDIEELVEQYMESTRKTLKH